MVRHAQAAERGKFLFVPDFPALTGEVETDAPMITLDPLMVLAAVALETNRIGMVATGLSAAQLASARPSPRDPRSGHALSDAQQGRSLSDVLAHGVIDYHPVIAGPAIEAADHMQEWFEAEAADGFWISPDVYDDGIDALVDGLVPIQERGLFHREYEGSALRDRLGAPAQYGIDPRLMRETDRRII